MIVFSVNIWRYREGPYWIRLAYIISLLAVVSETRILYLARKLLWKPDNRIIADYYATLSNKYVLENADSDAIKAIETACQMEPDEPRFWIQYSLIEKDRGKAMEHVDKAEQLIEEHRIQSDELLARLEYSKGALLLDDAAYTEHALEHLEKSLELNYSKNLADTIEKIREQRMEK